jgi:hypothetical protein
LCGCAAFRTRASPRPNPSAPQRSCLRGVGVGRWPLSVMRLRCAPYMSRRETDNPFPGLSSTPTHRLPWWPSSCAAPVAMQRVVLPTTMCLWLRLSVVTLCTQTHQVSDGLMIQTTLFLGPFGAISSCPPFGTRACFRQFRHCHHHAHQSLERVDSAVCVGWLVAM